MVWFHGGALLEGAGELYPGDALTRKGVILVTVNYRLGPPRVLCPPRAL